MIFMAGRYSVETAKKACALAAETVKSTWCAVRGVVGVALRVKAHDYQQIKENQKIIEQQGGESCTINDYSSYARPTLR